MNRNELKRISVKLSVDATKKQKEESRSKKLAERLVNFHLQINFFYFFLFHFILFCFY